MQFIHREVKLKTFRQSRMITYCFETIPADFWHEAILNLIKSPTTPITLKIGRSVVHPNDQFVKKEGVRLSQLKMEEEEFLLKRSTTFDGGDTFIDLVNTKQGEEFRFNIRDGKPSGRIIQVMSKDLRESWYF